MVRLVRIEFIFGIKHIIISHFTIAYLKNLKNICNKNNKKKKLEGKKSFLEPPAKRKLFQM
jgi:hypothetical protein